jgi:hypothetical protein
MGVSLINFTYNGHLQKKYTQVEANDRVAHCIGH